MMITDPTSQCNVGILTILGTPTNLHQGCRLTIKIRVSTIITTGFCRQTRNHDDDDNKMDPKLSSGCMFTRSGSSNYN
jgi:hypothetical protein